MKTKSNRTKLCLVVPCLAVALIILVLLLFFAWQHYYPAQSATGWSVSIYRDNIPRVAGLLRDARGNLYVSQEFRNGKGIVFQLMPDGARRNIISGLSQPSRMVSYKDGIIVSQEHPQSPVLWWNEDKTETWFTGDHIEGIVLDGTLLFAVEDVKVKGRLLEYDLEEKEVRILRENLDEPEGVAVCPDGGLFFTEKKKGWIKRYTPGADDIVVIRGLQAPTFLMCNDEGLWISEDRTHRARLLLLDASGKIQTILSHLRAPQTIITLDRNHFLLAEQGRKRILQLKRHPDARR